MGRQYETRRTPGDRGGTDESELHASIGIEGIWADSAGKGYRGEPIDSEIETLVVMKERVYSSTPVNKTAALVVSKPEFDDDVEYNTYGRIHSTEPLPTVDIKVSKASHNLTGNRYGNFVVQGAFLDINPKKGRLWVVKCDCGRYEVRRKRSLSACKENKNACVKCSELRNKLEKREAMAL